MSKITSEQVKISFTGHDTFPLRHGWLEKAYYAVEKNNENPFSTDEAIINFGVGKNMVNAIRHWALATNFIIKTDNRYEHSEYAQQLLNEAVDPYLENIGSLWKIHYELCKKKSCTTVYWLFSFLNNPAFSKEYLELRLKDFAQEHGKEGGKAFDKIKSIKTDINVVLAMYCRPQKSTGFKEEDIFSPLSELNLIRKAEDNRYTINTGLKTTLPQSLFISSIVDFWESQGKQNPTAIQNPNSIRVDSLLLTQSSPGRIFALSENELTDRLHDIERQTEGALSLSETAGILQIFKNSSKYNSKKLLSAWMSK